ncbi:hypothetical protein H6F78_19565 [Coleofasciculus sp. FACHB-64]|uniref:phospholipase A2 n=1 Tax=Trichocoleus sp. AS-A2 TaxID=2933922 RepID=UPI00198E7BB6|nr:hypothetical protein [Coleofasciculus sp. FACHB-501]MBD2047757.1 hypothetical protein [Coleofasciculus sp. FACHB-64]
MTVPSVIVVVFSGLIGSVPEVKAQTSNSSTNGCSYVPDRVLGVFSFGQACNNHDICYSSGSGISRKVCDDRFLQEMQQYCNNTYSWYNPQRWPCRGLARTYYEAVKQFSKSYYNGQACIYGYVWREAIPGDRVCVTPETRSQTAYDNSQAAARRNPNGGAYGSDTCIYGYVWREAFPSDHVCVTPETRSQAAYDNTQAAARLDNS